MESKKLDRKLMKEIFFVFCSRSIPGKILFSCCLFLIVGNMYTCSNVPHCYAMQFEIRARFNDEKFEAIMSRQRRGEGKFEWASFMANSFVALLFSDKTN